MAIYIFEFLLISLFGILYKVKVFNKKIFLFSSFFIMALLLALRGDKVGEDTLHYLNIFYLSDNVSWKNIFSGFDAVYDVTYGVPLSVESGYLALNKIVHFFTINGQCILAVVGFITCGLFGKFIYDNFKNVFFPTYIYMCESLYMNSFNLIRQILAISIAIQSFGLIKEKKYIQAVLVLFIAFLFHKTAVLLIVLFPLFIVKRKKRMVTYVALAMIVVNLVLPVIAYIVSAIVPRYSSYFTTNYWSANIGGIIFLWLIEIFICLGLYLKGVNKIEVFISISMTILYLGFELIGLNLTIFSRIALVFSPFLMFLFPEGMMLFNNKGRLIYQSIIMIILPILFFSYAASDARMYTFFWE